MARPLARNMGWPGWWAFVLLLAIVAPAYGASALPAAQLVPGEANRALAGVVQVLLDPSHDLTIEDIANPDSAQLAGRGRFQPLTGRYIDVGFVAARIWLRLPVVNAGNRPGTWILDLNTRFMSGLDAYVLPAGGGPIRLIVHDGPELSYPQRDVEKGVLAGRFGLQPGEAATIYIGYWSQGTTALPLTLETEASFADHRWAEKTKHAAFYTLLGMTIVYALILLTLWSSGVIGAYVVFLFSVLLYIAQIDGYAFQYLWPYSPMWNAHASMPLGMLLSACAANFVRVFLATKTLGRYCDIAIWSLIWLAALFMLAYLIFDPRLVKKTAFVLPMLVAAIALMIGVIALRRGRPGARFFVAGWVFLLLCTAVTAIIQWVPGVLENYAGFDFLRAGMVVDVLMMSAAIMDQINRLRTDRDEAQRRAFQTQHHLMSLRGALGTAERLAVSRGLALASASHDMRQPLFSLRAAMLQLVGHPLAGRTTIQQLQRSLAYLEELIERYLRETPKDAVSLGGLPLEAGNGNGHDNHDIFPVSDVLDNLHFMFAEDAAKRGLDFRYVRSSMSVDADALALMRIVSNFLANAIQYTDRGRVVLGCRCRGAEVAIEVHDSGRGIADSDMARLFDALERGESANGRPDGWGLGLAIAAGLAQDHGYRLEAQSVQGRGSVFRLIVPRA